MRFIDKVKDLFGPSSDTIQFARVADDHRITGELDKAIQICKEGLVHHPDYVTGHYILGKCYIDENLKDEAREAFLEGLQVDPNHLPTLVQLADIYKEEGDTAQALQYYQQAFLIDPLNTRVQSEFEQCGGVVPAESMLSPYDYLEGETVVAEAGAEPDADVASPPEEAVDEEELESPEKASEVIPPARTVRIEPRFGDAVQISAPKRPEVVEEPITREIDGEAGPEPQDADIYDEATPEPESAEVTPSSEAPIETADQSEPTTETLDTEPYPTSEDTEYAEAEDVQPIDEAPIEEEESVLETEEPPETDVIDTTESSADLKDLEADTGAEPALEATDEPDAETPATEDLTYIEEALDTGTGVEAEPVESMSETAPDEDDAFEVVNEIAEEPVEPKVDPDAEEAADELEPVTQELETAPEPAIEEAEETTPAEPAVTQETVPEPISWPTEEEAPEPVPLVPEEQPVLVGAWIRETFRDSLFGIIEADRPHKSPSDWKTLVFESFLAQDDTPPSPSKAAISITPSIEPEEIVINPVHTEFSYEDEEDEEDTDIDAYLEALSKARPVLTSLSKPDEPKPPSPKDTIIIDSPEDQEEAVPIQTPPSEEEAEPLDILEPVDEGVIDAEAATPDEPLEAPSSAAIEPEPPEEPAAPEPEPDSTDDYLGQFFTRGRTQRARQQTVEEKQKSDVSDADIVSELEEDPEAPEADDTPEEPESPASITDQDTPDDDLDDHDPAEHSYEEMEYQDPDDSREAIPTATLAELYVRQGLIDRAIAVYLTLIEHDPTNPDIHTRLSELFVMKAEQDIQ